DALAQLGVGDHVDCRVVVDPTVEQLDDRSREAALRGAARALHEQHHVARGDQCLNAVSRRLGLVHARTIAKAHARLQTRYRAVMAQPRSLDDHAAALARQLRRSIFRQLGWAAPLWLAGCSPAPPSGEEEGGVTTNPSSGNNSLEGEAEGEVGSTDDGTDTNADEDTGMMEESDTDGVRLDVSPLLDIPPPPACT